VLFFYRNLPAIEKPKNSATGHNLNRPGPNSSKEVTLFCELGNESMQKCNETELGTRKSKRNAYNNIRQALSSDYDDDGIPAEDDSEYSADHVDDDNNDDYIPETGGNSENSDLDDSEVSDNVNK